jgi:hypothetical protein
MNLLKKDIRKSGLIVLEEGGIFLKPFSNAQMEKVTSSKTLNALYKVSIKYPEISAEIFAVCAKKK